MSGSSSLWQSGAAGWEVIDEALDGIRRAAFEAKAAADFHATLTERLRPLEIGRAHV